MTDTAVDFIPYHEDAAARLVQVILEEQADRLPCLDHVVILLADYQPGTRLRRLLVEAAEKAGHDALFGPRIFTLRDWAQGQTPPARKLLPQASRQLLLVEALLEHPHLVGQANPWALAEALLAFFDELTLHRVSLPQSYDHFLRQLARAYGNIEERLGGLGLEARLVYTLWYAWHEQLAAAGQQDSHAHYLTALGHSLTHCPSELRFYAAGLSQSSGAEEHWLREMLARGQLRLLLHGEGAELGLHPASALGRLADALAIDARKPDAAPFGQFLDAVFHPQPGQLSQRARDFAAVHRDSPAHGRLSVFSADNFEQEARAIDLQFRRWYLAGKRRLALVTDDRKLARRVRARLERANINLKDTSGWALSTTAAAAAFDSWLQTLEEDFAWRPLLDVLKSPFVFSGEERDEALETIYRFEQDLVRSENIGRGLDRYQRALASRQSRLRAWHSQQTERLQGLLRQLAQAGAPLTRLMSQRRRPAQFLEALAESLERLGMTHHFVEEAAGSALLDLIENLRQQTGHSRLAMSWQDFRLWLAGVLETQTFKPEDIQAHFVELLHLPQTTLARYDGLVLAATRREHLPGAPPSSPFFNSQVRHELGLPAAEGALAERFYHFRRLLEAADGVLLSFHRGDDGSGLPSPWLELLQAFHEQAWGDRLENEDLRQLCRQAESEIGSNEPRPLPGPTRPPAPAAPAALLPTRYSASGHQQLIDCPYQFFAARLLGLQAPEEVREALAKSDYGERVHHCLEAFHSDVEGLPGPWRGPLKPGQREEAIALLNTIATAVFARDVEDNFQHRGWLARWQGMIPLYIDWAITRAEKWSVAQTEVRSQHELAEDLQLDGRLDRMDQAKGGFAIVDYKTGSHVPGEDELLGGEAVQLPHYAASADQPVTRVEYLIVDGPRVSAKSVLEGETLAELGDAIGERLKTMHAALKRGEKMPAWGDEQSCAWCAMRGVCRRDSWQE